MCACVISHLPAFAFLPEWLWLCACLKNNQNENQNWNRQKYEWTEMKWKPPHQIACSTILEWHRLLNLADIFPGMYHHVQPFIRVSFALRTNNHNNNYNNKPNNNTDFTIWLLFSSYTFLIDSLRKTTLTFYLVNYPNYIWCFKKGIFHL